MEDQDFATIKNQAEHHEVEPIQVVLMEITNCLVEIMNQLQNISSILGQQLKNDEYRM